MNLLETISKFKTITMLLTGTLLKNSISMVQLVFKAPLTTLALATVAMLAVTAATAADMPRRKPGLWQIETSMAAAPGMGPMKQCIDEKTDNFYQQFGEQHEDKCAESDIKHLGDRIYSATAYARSAARPPPPMRHSSGRFDSDYRGDIRIKYSPPMQGMSETSMAIAAGWLGPL